MVVAPRHRVRFAAALAIAGTIAALLVRLPFLELLSHDIIGFLGQWYDYIVLNGGVYALGDRFANYTPAYLYLLTAAAAVREIALPALSKVAAIKLPSIAADFAMALAVYKIVQVYGRDTLKPVIAYAIVLLLPTVVINSAVWGQADSLYTAWMLWCVYLLCVKRPGLAMALFGVGLSLKLQAIFFAPLLLFLLIRRAIGMRHLLLVPAVYAAVMAPAILLGRPPLEALGTYVIQVGENYKLSMGAPNLYVFASPDLYHPGLPAALAISAIAGLAIAVAFALRSPDPGPDDVLACALVCAVVMPFVLPKMHERYFFPADVLSVAAALRWRRLWWLPVAYQLISLASYATVLDALSWWNRVLPGVKTFTWLNALVVLVVVAGMIVARRTSLAVHRRNALLALAAGGVGALAVVAVTAALIPGDRRAPTWVASGAGFHPPQAASVTYDEAIELVGFDLPQPRTYRTGVMKIDLFFKPLRSLVEDYQLRVEAFAQDGRSLGLISEGPVEGAPLAAWLPGEVYLQQRFLTVWPSVDAPLLATIKVSWVDPRTGALLPTRCGDAACDSKIGLIPVALDYATVSPWLRAPGKAFYGPDQELALLDAQYAPQVLPGQTVPITTTWRIDAHAVGDLTLFLHVLSADGKLVAQADAQPRGGAYPTHTWHRGEVVIDTSRIALPEDAAPGDYEVLLGAYRSDTLERVAARSARGDRYPDDVVRLGTLRVQR